MSADHVQLAKRACEQIRDSLCALSFTDGGFHEDDAMAALDALDWLEDHLGLNLVGAEPDRDDTHTVAHER